MSPYLKIRLSLLHCFAFDFVSFLHFGEGQLTILKRWWSMSGFKEWKGRDWFGFSASLLCALKLNILRVVTAGTWAEGSFCGLINPSVCWDYTSIVRQQERSSNSFLATFHFNGCLLAISLSPSDQHFEVHIRRLMHAQITQCKEQEWLWMSLF